MTLAKLRSSRSMHRWERRWLVWNHGNWKKVDRMLRRAERHTERQQLRDEARLP